MSKKIKLSIFICLLTLVASYIALPKNIDLDVEVFNQQIALSFEVPQVDFMLFGKRINPEFKLRKGLDIQGGMQVVLDTDMSKIDPEKRADALVSAREIISNRVDQYGISEARIQTSLMGGDYRIIVELPGIKDQQQALALVGQTAKLDFRLQGELSPEATQSAALFLDSFEETDLTGRDLTDARLDFNQQTGEPVVALEFNSEGRDKFAQITKEHQGEVLAIFIDGMPVAMPRINDPILDGRAIMTGGFKVDEAKRLAISLRAGALPVEIEVLEQKAIGASLGEESVRQSIRAGLIGLMLVALFMSLYYGLRGVIASFILLIYAVLTIATYKIMGVTLTLPGIAGLLLTVGMAVDSNILIYERMKEELRIGRDFEPALEAGFGKAWDSIKDANLATILTALVLINPLELPFLTSSGLVRGFGVTLLLGVIISLFTGVTVSRNLLRVSLPLLKKFYRSSQEKRS